MSFRDVETLLAQSSLPPFLWYVDLGIVDMRRTTVGEAQDGWLLNGICLGTHFGLLGSSAMPRMAQRQQEIIIEVS